ncbi:MAG: sigma 54-interacting transcriptional regulator [Planctomycetaceae bacterium]
MEPQPLTPYLLVRDPAVGLGVTRLVTGERVTLGRAPTNHVVLHDERASRFHAEIFPTSAGWSIRDLQSRNGTLLCGEPLTADRQLAPGDVVSIGLAEIRYCEGDPPTKGTAAEVGAVTETSDLADAPVPARTSITHRRSRSRLLEDIHASATHVPRVGQAAAELCRLAFAVGRAADLRGIAALALDSALKGTGAARGLVLMAANPAAASPRPESLETLATAPDGWSPEPAPLDVFAAVLAGNEALLAEPHTGEAGRPATLSAPVRSHGRPVGVVHLEAAADRVADPDDLEYLMAVCDAFALALDNVSAREALSTKLANAADENERLRRRLGEDMRMVGESPALQGIVGQVQRVAATKATVLIRGESGVGKELVARAIHESSDRSAGPFVCLNCAALSETLLESELFGHEKGAFTGATERKIGKFEAAHRGTLMLDEIGEMSPAIQAKFLRVLEGHPFERVGGSARVQVDVRVVAATNRNLEDAVMAGGFRRDLYFRLKVVEILVPPLRRRREDVESIARHFLDRFAAETGRRFCGVTPAAGESRKASHWPGSSRVLRNCIERGVVLATGDVLDVDDLMLSQLAAASDSVRTASPEEPFVPTTIEEMERRHVMATLEAVGGNKTKAAAILGIERSTLDRKLAQWARA